KILAHRRWRSLPIPARLRRRGLLVRRKRVVTKPAAAALFVTEPAATALWLRPLLISAEIKKLCRGRSGRANHQPHRDGQRNQPTTLGEADASPFWSVWHAGPHTRRTCLDQSSTNA